jgi:hypothetical protein
MFLASLSIVFLLFGEKIVQGNVATSEKSAHAPEVLETLLYSVQWYGDSSVLNWKARILDLVEVVSWHFPWGSK